MCRNWVYHPCLTLECHAFWAVSARKERALTQITKLYAKNPLNMTQAPKLLCTHSWKQYWNQQAGVESLLWMSHGSTAFALQICYSKTKSKAFHICLWYGCSGTARKARAAELGGSHVGSAPCSLLTMAHKSHLCKSTSPQGPQSRKISSLSQQTVTATKIFPFFQDKHSFLIEL